MGPGLIRRVVRRLRGGAAAPPRRWLRQRLVFSHVPKCGGSSVRHALRRACHPDVRRSSDHRYVRIDARAMRRTSRQLDVTIRRLSEELLLYHLSRDPTHVVTGHVRHSDAAFARHGDRFRFVTFLRRPEDQLRSFYFFNFESSEGTVRITDPLATWLESDRARRRGRAFVDWFRGDVPWEGDGRAAIEAACENLSRYDLVGVLERQDEFAAAFSARYDVDFEFPHHNASPVGSEEQERQLTPPVRERIAELTEPNRRVYDFVVRELLPAPGPGPGPAPTTTSEAAPSTAGA